MHIIKITWSNDTSNNIPNWSAINVAKPEKPPIMKKTSLKMCTITSLPHTLVWPSAKVTDVTWLPQLIIFKQSVECHILGFDSHGWPTYMIKTTLYLPLSPRARHRFFWKDMRILHLYKSRQWRRHDHEIFSTHMCQYLSESISYKLCRTKSSHHKIMLKGQREIYKINVVFQHATHIECWYKNHANITL